MAEFGQPGDSGWDGTGTPPKAAAGPHQHPLPVPTAAITTFDNSDTELTSATVQGALEEISSLATNAVGPILISDDAASPFTFADLLQNDLGTDFVYAEG